MDDIEIVNYADDNTPYITADDIDGAITSFCFHTQQKSSSSSIRDV